MFKKLSTGDKTFTILNYLFLSMLAMLLLYPLIYVVSASLSDPKNIVLGNIRLFPVDFTFSSFEAVFRDRSILIGYRNSIIYTVVGTLINLVASTLIAFPLSRSDFQGKGVITAFITFTMFFSGGMIPNYLLIRDLGLLNTMWAIVLPGAVSVYNVIIMRTFFQSIPRQLSDAASIDGTSNIGFLWHIVLPLSRPILAVMTLFYGTGHWNAYFNAMIYIRDENKYPLQLFLRQMLIQEDLSGSTSAASEAIGEHLMQVEGLKYAVVVVASLPIIALYPFLQKYFEKGVMVGSLKG